MSDRQFVRIPLNLEVEYRTAGAFLVAFSVNLSKGGIYIETTTPQPIGTELVLKFTVPSIGPIEVRGTVVWVRQDAEEGKPPGMGVEFENLDEQFGEVIDRLAASFGGLKVLIVASNSSSRVVLARAVRSILGAAELIEAHDVEAAEEGFAHDPDLALVDLDDPECDGLATLRLAKTTVGRALPVIAISREEEQRTRASELGADEVLPNPPLLPDLQAAVMRATGKPMRVG